MTFGRRNEGASGLRRDGLRYLAAGVLISLFATVSCAFPDVEDLRVEDLEGARAAFLSNIQAIHDRDTEAYLSHYLDSPELVVIDADSMRLGFEVFAAARRADDSWPDTLIAGDPRLVWQAPGLVYGAYEYTVVVDGDTSSGWSERLFRKVGGGWKVAVTSVIQRID